MSGASFVRELPRNHCVLNKCLDGSCVSKPALLDAERREHTERLSFKDSLNEHIEDAAEKAKEFGVPEPIIDKVESVVGSKPDEESEVPAAAGDERRGVPQSTRREEAHSERST